MTRRWTGKGVSMPRSASARDYGFGYAEVGEGVVHVLLLLEAL